MPSFNKTTSNFDMARTNFLSICRSFCPCVIVEIRFVHNLILVSEKQRVKINIYIIPSSSSSVSTDGALEHCLANYHHGVTEVHKRFKFLNFRLSVEEK